MKNPKQFFILISISLFFILLSFPVYSEEMKETEGSNQEIVIHGIGKIDSSVEGDIVIDGKKFQFASSYYYKIFDEPRAVPDGFVRGTNVGYQLDEKKNICAIWIIKDKDLDEAKKIMEAQEDKRRQPSIPPK